MYQRITRRNCSYRDCPHCAVDGKQRYCKYEACLIAHKQLEQTLRNEYTNDAAVARAANRPYAKYCGSCKHGRKEPQSDTGYLCTIGKSRVCKVWVGEANFWKRKTEETSE